MIRKMGVVIVFFVFFEVRLVQLLFVFFYTRAKILSSKKYANSGIAKATLPPIFLFMMDVCMQKHGTVGVVCLFLNAVFLHNITPPTF